MRFITFILIIAGTLNASNLIIADTSYTDSINYALSMSINREYEKSYGYFSRMIELATDDPTGYFFYGIAMQSEMMEREEWEDIDSLCNLFTRAYELADRYEPDSWAYYIKGASYGYLALLRLRENKYLSAFPLIRSSVAFLKRSREESSTNYDAYLGLGGYYFWRSEKLGFLRYLFFMPDEREKGLEYLQLAEAKSRFSRDVARYAIINVLTEQKKFNEAKKLVKYLRQKYPNSLTPLWNELYVVEKEKDWDAVVRITTYMLENYRGGLGSNLYNVIELYYKKVKALEELGKYEQAVSVINDVLSLKIPATTAKRQGEKLSELSNLKEQLQAKY